jgi:hypothetical protein
VRRGTLLVGAALAAAALALAVWLPGPSLCLPPICRAPVGVSWPFNPAGLSGPRVVAVFAFFVLLAGLLALVIRRGSLRPKLLVGVPVAVALALVVVDASSPLGRWYGTDGRLLGPDGHPFVMSVELGPGHCGWQHVAFLTMAWPLDRPIEGPFMMSDPRTRVYVWQTGSAYPRTSLAGTPGTLELTPADARYTGLHRGSWQLWVSPSRLGNGVFLASGDAVERWAYVSSFVDCA